MCSPKHTKKPERGAIKVQVLAVLQVCTTTLYNSIESWLQLEGIYIGEDMSCHNVVFTIGHSTKPYS